MLVSVPLLFLHVKKFLPQRETIPVGPEREKGKERKNEIRVIEIIERQMQTPEEKSRPK